MPGSRSWPRVPLITRVLLLAILGALGLTIRVVEATWRRGQACLEPSALHENIGPFSRVIAQRSAGSPREAERWARRAAYTCTCT